MAVIVHTADDLDETIPDGVKWHIDDDNRLHVITDDETDNPEPIRAVA